MIRFYKDGTFVTYYDDNYVSGTTYDKSIFRDLRKIFKIAVRYPNSVFLYFKQEFENNDEALDFFCGNKWPSVFNDFVEEVVTKLTKGRLC